MLTLEEHERAAFISGHRLPDWIEDLIDDDSRAFKDTATDWKSISTPEDLDKAMQELNDLQAALPENVYDAAGLRHYDKQVSDIIGERDNALSALETLADGVQLLKARHEGGKPVTASDLQELADWIAYAHNEREDIDRFRFKQDLDIL